MDKISVLSRSSLFDMLANEELERVAEMAQLRRVPAGQPIFEQGELGDSVYVIVAGEAQVEHVDPDGSRRPLADLGVSDFFGEMSLIDKVYRSATVRARGEVELLQLTTDDLNEFRRKYPDGYTLVVLNIARTLAGRLREANTKLGPLAPKGAL